MTDAFSRHNHVQGAATFKWTKPSTHRFGRFDRAIQTAPLSKSRSISSAEVAAGCSADGFGRKSYIALYALNQRSTGLPRDSIAGNTMVCLKCSRAGLCFFPSSVLASSFSLEPRNHQERKSHENEVVPFGSRDSKDQDQNEYREGRLPPARNAAHFMPNALYCSTQNDEKLRHCHPSDASSNTDRVAKAYRKCPTSRSLPPS